jgi:serine/threonine-protein kinase HipA
MAGKRETRIWVYADWVGMDMPLLMGTLLATQVRGREIFSFEYDTLWLNSRRFNICLDPNLGYYRGNQFPPEEKSNFGLFLDSSPDRWGRVLMRRREALQAKIEARAERVLFDSDFLLGVHDEQRLGGLRFKTNPEGHFLDNQSNMSAPPWTMLRELEYASLQIEKADAVHEKDYSRWLNLLIHPGSSLGGARPKAGVMDAKGQLWIAKFPGASDIRNIGAAEMVLHALASACGIWVPEAALQKFSGKHSTYLSKRFDRTSDGRRIHFASAMTLLGYRDGVNHAEGVSYLELASFIIQHSPASKSDLEQLWRRIVFNILVSNTDDHLRNHGFLLSADGWRLSPAFDMNPNENGNGLTLNITEHSNEQDVSLALQTAAYYKLKSTEAEKILSDIQMVLSQWKRVAKQWGISHSEMQLMQNAFRL